VIFRIAPAARADIATAYSWYEDNKKGLGEEFIESVDKAVKKIGLRPLAYRKVVGDSRRCNIERFPNALFFRVKDNVVVVACLHAKRNPKLAKGARETPTSRTVTEAHRVGTTPARAIGQARVGVTP
jgi:plasmid stabilization system protein ParE